MDRLVQRLDAKVDFEPVQDAPGKSLSGKPVHDGDQMQKALSHRQLGYVGTPDLVGLLYPQPA